MAKLGDDYVIFITENDVLDCGLPVYDIQRYISNNGKLFGDGSHIIYVNSKIQDDTPLGRLMQDFYCADPDKMHYKELADKVKIFKEPKGSEDAMVDIIDEYAEKKAKQAAYQNSVAIAENMLADKMSVEAVARYSKLPIEEVRKLAEKRSA